MWPGPDDDLHPGVPGPLGQLAQVDQLPELAGIGGVGQKAGCTLSPKLKVVLCP
jgi:hypothetical protein